ncbi:MAG: acyl-CoA dehydrogenase [Solirubrobacteraceae bacterium]|nr:acyl-CoA dehydrogenase [Solirubrobacteraceae bacterium]
MFIISIPAEGLTVVPLRQLNGPSEFCQEFLDDVTLPANHLLGAANEGWGIAQELLQHERRALGGGSDYFEDQGRS